MLLALGYTASESHLPYLVPTMLICSLRTVIPVCWFTKPESGGFGFTPFMISLFLGVGGLSQALWLLLAFPLLQHRFGTGGVLRGCALVWPFFFAAVPVCNILLKHHSKVPFWAIAWTANVLGSGVAMAFST